MSKVTVISSGSWGTSLAILLCDNGHDVTMWTSKPEKAEAMNRNRENTEFLPGITLPDKLTVVSDERKAVTGSEFIVIATASGYIRQTLERFKSYINSSQIIINTSKGLEENTLKRLSQVIEDCCPGVCVAVLSGPSHAEEVARKIPTTCVVSSKERQVAEKVQNLFFSSEFRVYINMDLVGVELGGALKNVIALAAGVSDGMGFGDNTKAALMTRGIAEISRLGAAMGADLSTFNGLTGIGDLIVTCTSMHSRNRRAGILLGQGKSLDEAMAEVHMVVEGVNTARAANNLANKYGVEMPITQEINKSLFEGKDPRQAVKDLMCRDKTIEHPLLKEPDIRR